VNPRAVLDAVVKRKIPSPHQESNPRTPIVQPIAQCKENNKKNSIRMFDPPTFMTN
jgi:hypothetical protein